MKETTDYPIDFVVLYCDGDEPAFRARKNKYLPADKQLPGNVADDARTRDLGTFHFWFRAIEANAPWVRKIHLVTDNQVPEWLLKEHPKLHLVNHSDYIPQQYLPLFNSTAIEVGIHRIEGLAEHFVFFNDDTFINAPVTPDDFFLKGKPRTTFHFRNSVIAAKDIWYHMLFNNLRIVNKYCNSRRNTLGLIRRSVGQPYRRRHSLDNFVHIVSRALINDGFPFIHFEHQAVPSLRSTYERMWELEGDALWETTSHRFREFTDLSQHLFYFYDICSCNFEKSYRTNFFYSLAWPNIDKAVDAISKGEKQMLCVNDGDKSDFDFESRIAKIIAAFQKRYPNPCSFEIAGN